MSQLTLRCVESVDQLRSIAADWDDLWQRSDAELPACRAGHIALWMEHFGGGQKFTAITVVDGSRLVAALPLASGRLGRVVTVGKLPGNDWSACGDLLLDRVCQQPPVLDALIEGFNRLRWPLLALDGVRLQSHRWQMFAAALQRAKLKWHARTWWHIGQVEIAHDWPAYLASRSRNLRRYIQRSSTRAQSDGGVWLEVLRPAPADVPALLRRGFEVEDRSWKGLKGTSVLRNPEVFEYFLDQAQLLAASGELELVFLHHQDRPIAFEYGCVTRDTYLSVKVGYDEAFGHLSPGQLLRWHHLQQMHNDPTRQWVDYTGPLVDATARWSTQSCSLGRLAIALRRPTSWFWWRALARWSRLRSPNATEAAVPAIQPLGRSEPLASAVE